MCVFGGGGEKRKEEFVVWSKIVLDLESLRGQGFRIPLARNIKHFFDLSIVLDEIRKRNNA